MNIYFSNDPCFIDLLFWIVGVTIIVVSVISLIKITNNNEDKTEAEANASSSGNIGVAVKLGPKALIFLAGIIVLLIPTGARLHFQKDLCGQSQSESKLQEKNNIHSYLAEHYYYRSTPMFPEEKRYLKTELGEAAFMPIGYLTINKSNNSIQALRKHIVKVNQERNSKGEIEIIADHTNLHWGSENNRIYSSPFSPHGRVYL